MAKLPPRFVRELLLILLLVSAVLLVFGQIRSHEFVNWDDDDHILLNPHIKPVTFENVIRHVWVDPYNKHRPMRVTYSFWALEAFIDQQISGRETEHFPLIFHLGSLLLHSLCVILVFVILRRLVGDTTACAGALVFGIHPVQVESVALVAATDVLLSGLFSLLSIWQYLCFRDSANVVAGRSDGPRGRPCVDPPNPPLPRGGAWIHYALATVCLLLALSSKPTAASVPLIVLVLDCWMGKRSWWRSLVAVLPWIVLVAVFALIMTLQERDVVLAHYPIWIRPLVAADALAFYLHQLFLPQRLCFDYGRSPDVVLQSGWSYATRIGPYALVVLVLTLFWIKRRGSAMTSSGMVSVGLFVAATLPTLGLIPHYFQSTSTVVDRYVYLAMLGPALAVAHLVARPHWPARVVCLVVLCLLGARSHHQTKVWQDSVSLFQHTLTVNPQSFTACINLGNTLRDQNDLTGAIEQYNQAISIRPTSAEAHNNLGVVLVFQGDLSGAVSHFQRALDLDRDFVGARENLERARKMLRDH